jgi:glycosyltransferase involved in cell wall biosynthesis
MMIFQHIDEYHPFDGIGNDCRGLRKIFQKLSLSDFIVTQRNFCPEEENVLLVKNLIQKANKFIEINQNSIHILHYGGSGYPLDFFLNLPGRKFLRFHNVTPSEFYQGCNESVFISMDKFFTKSVLELSSLSNEIELAICDSNTNAEFIKQHSSIPTITIPIVKDYTDLTNFNSKSISLERKSFNEKEDLVFVGRIVPNKKIQDIIVLFFFWKKINPTAKLHLIGGLVPGIEEYFNFINSLIIEFDLVDSIKIYFKIDDTQKSKILQDSLYYISMSEHEGFGIPLLEAMQNHLVVVAYASTAIPETMKRGGILFYEKNFPVMVEILNKIKNDTSLYDSVLATQEKALQYYKNYPFLEKIQNIFLNHKSEIKKFYE